MHKSTVCQLFGVYRTRLRTDWLHMRDRISYGMTGKTARFQLHGGCEAGRFRTFLPFDSFAAPVKGYLS